MKILTKHLVLIYFSFLTLISFSQTFNYVTSSVYDSLKTNGLLTGNEVILSDGMVTVNPKDIYQEFIVRPKAQGCGGYFDPPGPPLDVTGADDGWAVASPMTLPFTFCFFGDSYNQVWLNNNGNISFNGGISTFTPSAFPSTGNEMIAAFWADVDLAGSGTVHGTITPTAAVFNWVDVGYFNDHSDKINTFQIVITDGTDPLVQNGNVGIFYGDMAWTTGDLSSGTNGFGGSPATAGANRGNGIDYFQIGRFDHAGIDYDGPNGNVDGVDWLDNASFYFDFCTVNTANVDPIPLQAQYCDTIRICQFEDTLDITFGFLSPENNQNTTVTYSAPTLTNEQVLSNTVGVNGELILRIIGALETPGIHNIDVTATDDGTPAGVTTITYTFEILDAAQAFPVDPVLEYTPGCSPITFSVANGPFDGYEWETGSTDSSIVVNGPFNDTLTVILDNGCKFVLDSVINVPAPLTVSMVSTTNESCALDNGELEVAAAGGQGNITYTLNTVTQASGTFTDLNSGTYWVYAQDQNMCIDSVQVTVNETSPPVLSLVSADTVCIGVSDATVEVSTTGGQTPYNYSVDGGSTQATGVFNNLGSGIHDFAVIDGNNCPSTLQVTVDEYPLPTVQSDTVGCNLGFQVNGTTSFNGGIWTVADTSIHFQPDSSVANPFVYSTVPGNYTLVYTDDICGNSESFNVYFPPYVFAYSPDTTLCYGVEYDIALTVEPTVSSILWSNGATTPTITVTEEGVYVVVVSNECHSGTDTIYVDYKLCDIIPPNVISLSSNVGNQIWYVDQDGIKTFNCVIVNRWGDVIFEFDNPAGYWDGTSNGKKVAAGTYFYKINAVTEGDEEINKHGFIEVIE